MYIYIFICIINYIYMELFFDCFCRILWQVPDLMVNPWKQVIRVPHSSQAASNRGHPARNPFLVKQPNCLHGRHLARQQLLHGFLWSLIPCKATKQRGKPQKRIKKVSENGVYAPNGHWTTEKIMINHVFCFEGSLFRTNPDGFQNVSNHLVSQHHVRLEPV